MADVRLVCPPPCGHVIMAPDEEMLVSVLQDHVRVVHGHDLARAEVEQLIDKYAQRE